MIKKEIMLSYFLVFIPLVIPLLISFLVIKYCRYKIIVKIFMCVSILLPLIIWIIFFITANSITQSFFIPIILVAVIFLYSAISTIFGIIKLEIEKSNKITLIIFALISYFFSLFVFVVFELGKGV